MMKIPKNKNKALNYNSVEIRPVDGMPVYWTIGLGEHFFKHATIESAKQELEALGQQQNYLYQYYPKLKSKDFLYDRDCSTFFNNYPDFKLVSVTMNYYRTPGEHIEGYRAFYYEYVSKVITI